MTRELLYQRGMFHNTAHVSCRFYCIYEIMWRILLLALSPLHAGRLQLNAAKTEFMRSVPPRRRHQLPIGSLVIDTLSVDPVTSVRHLGVHLL